MQTILHRLATRDVTLRFIWLALFAVGENRAADLTFYTEERPPTNYAFDGVIVGSATDTIRVMLARARLRGRFEIVPWQRAISLAEHQENTCAYATKRNKERETNFRWLGPVSSAQAILYARAGSTIHLQNLTDAKRYRIGGYLGDAFAASLRDAGYTVELVDRNALNGNKLINGRIDLWIGNRATSATDTFAKLIPALKLPQVDLYVACHRNISPEAMARLAGALRQMRRDGTFDTIQARYGSPSRLPLHSP